MFEFYASFSLSASKGGMRIMSKLHDFLTIQLFSYSLGYMSGGYYWNLFHYAALWRLCFSYWKEKWAITQNYHLFFWDIELKALLSSTDSSMDGFLTIISDARWLLKQTDLSTYWYHCMGSMEGCCRINQTLNDHFIFKIMVHIDNHGDFYAYL